ncbi:uncharacterized protein LOC124166805 [Ischnura elegans]|uniref:uncharacterized protein LOC124166805 n=1 Tax=Ischnura elegans TaxID=197161 RepID=UPI001ED8BE80|nr:uncharacterized protein LOC124166805 [Ischnura elegans]
MATICENSTSTDDGKFVISLMNLSDDVLLHILSYLKSNDLLSLGRTCSRLQRVTSDKSLWNSINYKADALSAPFLFLHENMCSIGSHTRSITITGKTNRKKFPRRTARSSGSSGCDSSSSSDDDFVDVKYNIEGSFSMENKTSESVVENGESPVYPLEDFPKLLKDVKHNIDKKWLRLHLLSPFSQLCPGLHTLQLQYLRLFYYAPPILPMWESVTRLSLRGSRLLSKTPGKHGPLYGLSVKLPNLECLDIGCCSWVESHCFMAISKFNKLRTLLLDSCPNLGNCVAYISLAACLGFPVIEEIDLRDTQFGDSDLLSFKRNATIKKIILGRQVKYVKKQVNSSDSEDEEKPQKSAARGSGETSSGTQCNNGTLGGRKRKKFHRVRPMERKRARYGEEGHPMNALVIQVDLRSGVRVQQAQHGYFNELVELDDSHGNAVTDEGIFSLGIDGLPALEHLVLAGSGSGITDASLNALKKRTGLRYLDVRRTRVTKAGCESFMKNCPDVNLDCDFGEKIAQPSSSY